MAVKAVHLKVVSDLTFEAFISALKRFFSRREKHGKILLHKGSNFIRANHYLTAICKLLAAKFTQDQIVKLYTSQQIKLFFIPENSPHYGGIWKAAVKSRSLLPYIKQLVEISKGLL